MPQNSASWPADTLSTLAEADEVGISSRRGDGSLRPYITIWAVVADGGVYVRSAYGAGNGWYRRAVASGAGSIEANGTTYDVTFTQAGPDEQAAIDAAYSTKYAQYTQIVKGIVGPSMYDVTLRLEPVGC